MMLTNGTNNRRLGNLSSHVKVFKGLYSSISSLNMTQACIVWVQKKELVSREHENRRGNKGTWIQEYKE